VPPAPRSCISKVEPGLTDAEAQTGLLAVLQSGSADIPETVPKRPGRPVAHDAEFHARVAHIYLREYEAGNRRADAGCLQ